jgi:hypothetical protein
MSGRFRRTRTMLGNPLLGQGGVDATSIKLREASFDGADGVVRSTTDYRWIERSTLNASRCRARAPRPSAPAKEASRHLITRAATPPLPPFAKEGTGVASTARHYPL